MLLPNVRMSELGVDLVGVESGVDVLEEMIRVGTTAAHPIPVGVVAAPEGADPAPAPSNAGGGRVMRWNNNTSGFVLRRIAHPQCNRTWTYHLMAEDGVSHGPMVIMKQFFRIKKVATRDDCFK